MPHTLSLYENNRKESMNRPLSNCHSAPLVTHMSNEGTGHYRCAECGRACDWKVDMKLDINSSESETFQNNPTSNTPPLPADVEQRFDDAEFAPEGNQQISDMYANDYVDWGKVKAFLAQEIQAAIEAERARIKDQLSKIEVRSEQRYLSESGFWSKRELIAKNDVLQALTPPQINEEKR